MLCLAGRGALVLSILAVLGHPGEICAELSRPFIANAPVTAGAVDDSSSLQITRGDLDSDEDFKWWAAQRPPPGLADFYAMSVANLCMWLNAEFKGDVPADKSGMPGVLLRTQRSSHGSKGLRYCCGTCPDREGADCKVSSALYHKDWSIAGESFAGSKGWRTSGAQKGQIMSTYMLEWLKHDYVIVWNKEAVTPAIRCAYSSDGQTERRLGHGCGCPCGPCCSNLYQLPCAKQNYHRGQGSPEIVGCHCTSTSQALYSDDTTKTCYWKGPAFIDGNGTTGTNELSQFVQHRLFARNQIGYHTTLYHWTEVVLGAVELNALIEKDPSQVIVAFAMSRHCGPSCQQNVFAIRDEIASNIPVISFDDLNADMPFQIIPPTPQRVGTEFLTAERVPQ